MPRQRSIIEYLQIEGDIYIVVQDIPVFLDVYGGKIVERGPYYRGDEIRRGEISDVALKVLKHHGWIAPKK